MRILHRYKKNSINANVVFLIDNANRVYEYDPEHKTYALLFVIEGGTVDLASTNDKMWSPGFREYDITLNPFTATPNRSVVGGGAGTAMTAIDNNTIITAYTEFVTKWDVSVSPATGITLFTLPAGRKISGDILYNPTTNHFLLTTSNLGSGDDLTEYTYTGEIVADTRLIPSSLFGLFEFNKQLYAISCDVSSTIYRIIDGVAVAYDTVPFPVYGASQRTQNMTLSLDLNPAYTNPMKFTVRVAAGMTYTIPSNGKYNYIADFGDGSEPVAERTHTYATAGDYQITITGYCNDFTVNGNAAASQIISIDTWGDTGLLKVNMRGCNLLTSIPSSNYGLRQVYDFNSFMYGCTSISTIPANVFQNSPLVINFTSAFRGCSALSLIPDHLFDYNQSVTSFDYLFYQCYNIPGIPDELFRYNKMAKTYTNAFTGCINITAIPSGLFSSSTNLSNSAFYGTFRDCTNITAIPSRLFDTAINAKISVFRETFYNCTKITSIPADLFKYSTQLTSSAFNSTFYNTGITSIPADLFRYNTLVSDFGFSNTFSNCIYLSYVPADLFKYNPYVGANGFSSCFYACYSLTEVPAYLFRHNTAVSSYGFYRVFGECRKLRLNKYIFYAEGEQSTRFLNRPSNFSQAMYRSSYGGVQGEAPDLWNCDFGTEIPVTGSCYYGGGNNINSISNYIEIPSSYK